MSNKDKEEREIVDEEMLTSENETTNQDLKEDNEIEELQSQLKDEKDRNLRLFAEFENFKKRTNRERIELFTTASEGLMTSLLPVLDDFDRALLEIEKTGGGDHLEGIILINNKLRETLKAKALKVTETKQGDVFNADIHEAITQIPAPSSDLKGKIVDVIEKGYALGNKIIRFPKVIIGK